MFQLGLKFSRHSATCVASWQRALLKLLTWHPASWRWTTSTPGATSGLRCPCGKTLIASMLPARGSWQMPSAAVSSPRREHGAVKIPLLYIEGMDLFPLQLLDVQIFLVIFLASSTKHPKRFNLSGSHGCIGRY